jgi:hypothetical protein
MTTMQRDAISSPAQGLKIFNTDDRCEDVYDGKSWAKNCDMRQNGVAILPANNWRPKAEFPGQERRGAVSFVINGKGYVGLGNNGSTYFSDFWEYNPITNLCQKLDFEGLLSFNLKTKQSFYRIST